MRATRSLNPISIFKRPLCPSTAKSLPLSPLTRRANYTYQSYNNYATNKTILWSSITANVGVFLYWRYAYSQSRGSMADMLQGTLSSNSSKLWPIQFLNNNFLISWDHIRAGRYWTLITSAFSHQDLGHLAGNMFSLYAFGSVLMSAGLSPLVFTSILLGSAVAGNIGFLYHDRQTRLQNDGFRRRMHGLGASGAVLGVGTAAAMLFPTAPMLLFGIVPCPLGVLLLGYVWYDSYYLSDPMSVTGHAAHLGGAAFGAAAYMLYLRRFGGILGRRRWK